MVQSPVQRVVAESGVPTLVELLAEQISASDLSTLLLEVFRRRAELVAPGELLVRYSQNRFVKPSSIDPAKFAAFFDRAWSLKPPLYEGLELSPVAPLGTSSAVATVDQSKVISALRSLEVVADSTNVLALEAAIRRRVFLRSRVTRSSSVFLAAAQRQVRAQPHSGADSLAHFGLFALVAAGRDVGSFHFESRALVEHLAYFLHIARAACSQWRLSVALTDLADRRDSLEAGVRTPLVARFPDVEFGFDPTRTSGRGYYVDVCFKIFATNDHGESLEIGDGGCTDWTAKLLSDNKERLVIAGLGVDRLVV